MKKILHKTLLPLAIILVIVVFFVALDIFNANKINYGTKIAGISVSGMSKDEALNKIIPGGFKTSDDSDSTEDEDNTNGQVVPV